MTNRQEQSNTANRRRRTDERLVQIPACADKRRRAALEQDSEAWIWTMCGPKSSIREPLVHKFTSQQSEMIGTFNETLKHGGDELVLASRGEGKTTYLRASVWKAIAEGSIDFIAFISATGSDAGESMRAIKDMICRSEPFMRLYPEIAAPVISVGGTSQKASQMLASGRQHDSGRKCFDEWPIGFDWSADGIEMPNVPGSPSAGGLIRFRGADSAIRGLNIYGKRPKLVVMDDLDSPDTVNNFDVAKKVIDRVNLDIGGLGTKTTPLSRVMLATLPSTGIGVAHHFASSGEQFVVKTFRYLIEKPIRWDLWMEYVSLRQKGKASGDKHGRDAHKFYLRNRAEMDAGAEISNPWGFKSDKLPDGSQLQVSPLQNYFDEWADKGEWFCRCELDNELVENKVRIESSLEMGHVVNCEGDYARKAVDPTTSMIVRGIDVRKIELHQVTMAADDIRRHRIIDYDVRSHGTTQTTVEQAEVLILEALHSLADEWDKERFVDTNGVAHTCDLSLIDKGWLGNWTEDGERKTWASQPVETFCMERSGGLRRWLPAKGAPNYVSPKPADDCIIGDNWHMNRGIGKARRCTELVWNADHWHALVEDLFLLPDDDEDRFELFVATDGIYTNHKGFAEHIREGSHDMKDRQAAATRTRKPRFRRDHWFDSAAMMLVGQSVEHWFRENLKPAPRRQTARYYDSPANHAEEIGAR